MIDEMTRLAVLQQRIFRCIEDELREDGHHKSYEGAIDVSLCLPNMFEQERGPTWIVELHCYVLPLDGRHQSWEGRTLAEAIAAAESSIDKLCRPYEMERFSRDVGLCEDEEGEAEGDTKIYAAPRNAEPPA